VIDVSSRLVLIIIYGSLQKGLSEKSDQSLLEDRLKDIYVGAYIYIYMKYHKVIYFIFIYHKVYLDMAYEFIIFLTGVRACRSYVCCDAMSMVLLWCD